MLAILLLIFILTIHIPHLFIDSDRTPTLIALLKDISLMGGSLMIAGIYSEEETGEKKSWLKMVEYFKYNTMSDKKLFEKKNFNFICYNHVSFYNETF